MKKQDLTNITLNTPIYHPLLGLGYPTQIHHDKIRVRFSEGVEDTFELSGSVVDCKFLKYLYLHPIEIVPVK